MRKQNQEKRLQSFYFQHPLQWGIATAMLIGFCWSTSSTAYGAKKHPLTPAVKVAKRSLKAAKKVDAFTANFSKWEMVGGKLLPKSSMAMKWRAKPLSVYFKFQDIHKGREVIYVEGENDGNLLVHEAGIKSIVGTLSFDPTAKRVMSETRYPITRSGLTKMVEGVIEQWEKEMDYGDVKVRYYKDAKLNGRACRVVETFHPTRRKEFAFYKTRLYIDAKTILPICVQQYGFPTSEGGKPPLVEEYQYSNIKTGVKLKDIDFDKENPAYGF